MSVEAFLSSKRLELPLPSSARGPRVQMRRILIYTNLAVVPPLNVTVL